MNRLVTIAALALSAAPLAAQADQPQLSLDQRMLLRCSAAFAMTANRQQAGHEQALQWPDLRQRGSEYFIRASARVMDETGLSREAVARILSAEAQEIVRTDTLAKVMPPCLLSLEASQL